MGVCRFALVTLAFAVAGFGQTEYFPLDVGNQWVYRGSGIGQPASLVVDIPRTETVNGRQYAVVRNLNGPESWLRVAEDGTLYRYDPESRNEAIWAVFSTPAGGEYKPDLGPCNTRALVTSREGRVKTPAGEFFNALLVTYPPSGCADAGLTSEAYVQYIGLVERNSTSFAGPRSFKLAYARIGGVTVISEPELSFAVTLDQRAYTGNTLTARLTLRSTHPEPVVLAFSSGQRYDLAIKDESGREVYHWSADKSFIEALSREEVSGERNWVIEVPLGADGRRLAPGRYTAEAWLTTMAPSGPFRGAVGFEIKEASN